MAGNDDELIAWLGSAAAGVEALGGKGASLDRLVRLGYRVPPGFCLTTAAFRRQGEVAPTLAAAVDRLVSELAALEVGEPRFAVRSSAIGEDGSAASYAGLHETELDVPPGGVADAVQRCWASLWSDAAVAYRERRGLSDADAAMAVVVQALVPADASAVVFTRHPVTGRGDQLVVTAVRGLGDAMVAGTITPDTYVIARGTHDVETFEPGEDPAGAALTADALAALVDLSLALERDFGGHVDIEAALAGDSWFVLQARPITTGIAQASA